MKYIIVALVLVKLYQVGSAPEIEQRTIDAGDWRTAFAFDLLHRLNNDQPSTDTVAFIIGWTIAEDGSDGAFIRNNPLNTTQNSSAATHSINGDGVKGYATYEDGLDATVQTLSYGYYTEIVAGLQTNDPQRAYVGLINSPWASSRYGGSFQW